MEEKRKMPPSYDEEVFEAAFSEFWESRECDDLNWVLYDLIKAAYAAGYKAAGIPPPGPSVLDGERGGRKLNLEQGKGPARSRP